MTDYPGRKARRYRRYVRCLTRLRAMPIDLSGDALDTAWDEFPWTETFVDITGQTRRLGASALKTRLKMAWDERVLLLHLREARRATRLGHDHETRTP